MSWIASMSQRFTSVAALAVGLALVSTAAVAPRHAAARDSQPSRTANFTDWATIYNTRFGFQVAYPSAILLPVASPEGNDGRVLRSADGKARMIVATFDNTENLSLTAYRSFLLSDIYNGTELDYQPLKPRWFVLSGVKGDQIFYERVTFSCGGRLINSWALTYPAAERKLYDRVVERIAKTYSVGAGADGSCGDGDPVRGPKRTS
jgi:hypothetical protein